MSFIIPEEFFLEKFYEHAGYPRYKSHNGCYEAGCPICREGKSWGRKRRLYYYVRKNTMFCYNCGWSGTPVKWIAELENITEFEVIRQAKGNVYQFTPTDIKSSIELEVVPSLPGDCINLNDPVQIKNNLNKLESVINYIKSRRLDTAVNKPKALWYCENDKTHYNRLIIPYYYNGKIYYYQSRGIDTNDKRVKYLSKRNGQVCIFNYDNIDSQIDSVFIFEGPIDSFFLKNGIALGGINTSKKLFNGFQEDQMESLRLYKRIWVLDNQHVDETSKIKTKSLIDAGETCFIWPKELKDYKDFNELCVSLGRDELSENFVKKHSFKGASAKMRMSVV